MRLRAWICTFAFFFSLTSIIISIITSSQASEPKPKLLEVTLRAMLFPVKTNAHEYTLVVYNEEMKRATYVTIKKKPDGEWAGVFRIPPASKKYVDRWSISAPSASTQRYFSFLYRTIDDTHMSIDLDVDLVAREEIQRVDFHKKNAQTF